MKRLSIDILSVVLLLTFLIGSTYAADPPLERYLVKIEGPPGNVEKAVTALGGKVTHVYNIIPGWIAVEIPEAAVSGLERNPRVISIEPDATVYAIGQELPWGVDRIDADLVHSTNKGSGVKVGIIDTGIDLDHPDLTVIDNVTFVNGTKSGDDDNGHGTHCAGIVAAEDNTIGVIGVAPEASIYAVKVLDAGGSGYVSDVIAGIQWSKNNEMQIISMSLGGSYNEGLEAACDAAYEAGIILVAAAGNSGTPSGKGDNVIYPARYESVIAVAATDQDDNRWRWSSTGPDLELAAPGVDITSTYLDGGYAIGSGTSMACPHVTGTAALVIASGITDANNDGLINDDVRIRLQETAEDLGEAGRDNLHGWGLVDASYAALQWNELWPVISFSESGQQGLMVWSIHHSWQENQYMYYSLWNGSSWSSAIPFTTAGWRHYQMSIDYKPGKPGKNEAMLVFGGSRYFLTFDDICYVEWDGSEWGKEEYYLADAVDDDDYQGTFKWSPDGSYGLNIWVDDNVWSEKPDKRAIAYSKWEWDASSSSWGWGTSASITTDEQENFTRHGDGGLDFDSSYPDGEEKAIVTYYRNDGYDSEIYYQVWDGSSWDKEVQLTKDNSFDNSFDDTLPWVKFDGQGNGIIIWQRHDGDDWEIYYSLWDGSAFNFTGESAMTDNEYDDNNPTAVYDSQGILHIFWYQKVLGTDTKILYSTFYDKSFSEPIQITDNDGRNVDQLPSIDNDGNIHLVWLQHDGNNYEVMHKIIHDGNNYEDMRTIIDPPLLAKVNIEPGTFNLRSSGKWITCYIELPEGYNVADINVSTVKMSKVDGTEVNIPEELKPTEIGDYDDDYDDDGIPDLMVRFDRADVGNFLAPADQVELSITGELTYGTPFEGIGTIRVIDEGEGLMKKVAGINLPDSYGLFQNYPNPFNPEAEIRYQLPKSSEVSLNIYNLMGQEIKTLVNTYHSAGYYSVKWNGTNNQGMKVASGVYIYVMRAGSFVDVKKLVFIQ